MSEALGDWATDITIAIIGVIGISIVAIINGRQARKAAKEAKAMGADLQTAAAAIDTHDSHIVSIEERLQTGERRLSQTLSAVAVLFLWMVLMMVQRMIEFARNGK